MIRLDSLGRDFIMNNVSNSNTQTANLFGKEVSDCAKKGAMAGAGVGLAAGGATYLFEKRLISPMTTNKDEFIKTATDRAVKMCEESGIKPDEKLMSDYTERAAKEFDKMIKMSDDALKELKKNLPSKMLAAAGVCVIAGAVIGSIVNHFKNKD